MNVSHTVKDVAQYMLRRLEKDVYLYQQVIVSDIKREFGDGFVYENANGNLAIKPNVLKEFRKLTEHDTVWERGSRLWRKRETFDTPGKRQTD